VLAAIANNYAIAKNLNVNFPYPYTEKNAMDFINHSNEKFLQKQEMHFGIINETHKLIGVIGLHEMDYNDKKCDIGIWIGSAYQGFGYSTEAYKLLLGFALYNLNFNRVYTFVFPSNHISLKTLKKIGFVEEGLLRENAMDHEGKFSDQIILGLLRKEYKDTTEIIVR
jgi:ribosomal-protein-alanine N-acetyltransferase